MKSSQAAEESTTTAPSGASLFSLDRLSNLRSFATTTIRTLASGPRPARANSDQRSRQTEQLLVRNATRVSAPGANPMRTASPASVVPSIDGAASSVVADRRKCLARKALVQERAVCGVAALSAFVDGVQSTKDLGVASQQPCDQDYEQRDEHGFGGDE